MILSRIRVRYFYLFALVFSLLAFALSCTRLPNVQGKGEALLQGVWNQDSIAN
ncbi:MAG: fumarate hydratase, partial [Pedobacter sp.]